MKLPGKIYYLCTCSTCKRIIKDLGAEEKKSSLREIRTVPLTADELDRLRAMAGSYEALFNRRSLTYRKMGLKGKALTEKDFRRLILAEETFLKRPVILVKGKIFIGSDPRTLAELKAALAD